MENETRLVTVVDYGLGNLFSIKRAIERIGAEALITDDPKAVAEAQYLVFPGVGAFGEGISNLHAKNLAEPIQEVASSGRPVLGICLGMQLLMTESEELGLHRGLGLIRGRVVRFPAGKRGPGYKIPQIGWNSIHLPGHLKGWDGTILECLREGEFMYFVHSYVVVPEAPSYVLAVTTYGDLTYCSVIRKDNIYGCQFHPEKSGEPGLDVYRNFLNLQ